MYHRLTLDVTKCARIPGSVSRAYECLLHIPMESQAHATNAAGVFPPSSEKDMNSPWAPEAKRGDQPQEPGQGVMPVTFLMFTAGLWVVYCNFIVAIL